MKGGRGHSISPVGRVGGYKPCNKRLHLEYYDITSKWTSIQKRTTLIAHPSPHTFEMAAHRDEAVFSIDPSEFVASEDMADSFFDRSAVDCQALDEDEDDQQQQPASPSPSSGGRIRFHPFIRTVQKIVLYETKSRFYIVGSNNAQDRCAQSTSVHFGASFKYNSWRI